MVVTQEHLTNIYWFFKNNFRSSSSFSGKRKAQMSKKNLFFGNLLYSHYRDHFIGDLQLPRLFNLNFWTFQAKTESNVWSLKRPTFIPLPSRPSRPSFPVFKTINKLKWYWVEPRYNEVLGITKYFLYPSNSKIYEKKKTH